MIQIILKLNEILTESQTYFPTERSDVSKYYLMLMKSMFGIIKPGTNCCRARLLLFKYYVRKLGEVLLCADSADTGGGTNYEKQLK